MGYGGTILMNQNVRQGVQKSILETVVMVAMLMYYRYSSMIVKLITLDSAGSLVFR